MSWACSQCGKCCKFIVVPVKAPVDSETEEYLEAHGIAYKNGRLLIPAVCKYLTKNNRCGIHECKFSNCRLGGKKECEEAQKDYAQIET